MSKPKKPEDTSFDLHKGEHSKWDVPTILVLFVVAAIVLITMFAVGIS